MGVSQSGYFARKARSGSRSLRDDFVMLEYVRSAYSLSNETNNSPPIVRGLENQGSLSSIAGLPPDALKQNVCTSKMPLQENDRQSSYLTY